MESIEMEALQKASIFPNLIRRYIVFMIAFISLNISVIYHQLRIDLSRSQVITIMAFSLIGINLIIILSFMANFLIALEEKLFKIKDDFFNIVLSVTTVLLFLIICLIIICILNMNFPDWIQDLNIQCSQIIVIQVFVLIDYGVLLVRNKWLLN